MEREWNPEDVAHLLDLEMASLDKVDHARLARKRLIEASPMAAEAVAHLSRYSENEGMRFNASRYILDQVIGKPDADGLGTSKDELADVMTRLLADTSTAN